MAARSVRMRVFNLTSASFQFAGSNVDHGEITAPPPQTVAPGQLAEWRAESSGIATGTEGSVDYSIEGHQGRLHFGWDNPFVGNTFFDIPAVGSEFAVFTLRFAYDESHDPPHPLLAVTQGDMGDEDISL